MLLEEAGAFGRVQIAHPTTSADTLKLIGRSRSPRSSTALERCLEVVGDAQTVVFENDYYDLDFRSEYAHTHARDFKAPISQSTRLHFFRRHHDWSDLVTDAAAAGEMDNDGRPGYLGYMILRPVPEGIVGRTMLAPPIRLDGFDDLADSVRTAVTEVVTFFGQPLRVTAVPFMQQDGTLLACAHVTAWMAHFSAVLAKHAPRRPVADFALLTGQMSTTRRYPSSGLTTEETVQLLEAVGTPPATYSVRELLDRAESPDAADMQMWQALPPERRRRKPRESLAALSSEVCRYLNSGLPVIACVDDHQVVICGYQRGCLGADGRRSITHFVVHDDVLGPYLSIPVPEQVSSNSDGDFAHKKTARFRKLPKDTTRWHRLVFPAPRGVLTTGLEAERAAGGAAEWAIEEFIPTLEVARDSDDWTEELGESYSGLLAFRRLVRQRRVALRTYATQSVAFKTKYAYRTSAEGGAISPEPYLVELVRELALPKYIWVVEYIDRQARDNPGDLPAVLGEAIIDAGATPQAPHVRMAHVPGFFIIPTRTGEWQGKWVDSEPESIDDDDGTSVFFLSPEVRYHTGRPSLTYNIGPSVYGQSKAIGASAI